MITQLKHLLVGKPLDNAAQQHQRLAKPIALAVFSSDALSSVAYASEAILGVLILVGSTSLSLVVPISLGIVVLLAIVGFSYRQTIHAYPNGGGAYIVAHDNLGKTPGLIAAASLLIDYVLTVAVSISAGVAALTALATTWGFTDLERYSVDVALVLLAVVTLINLRGVKESGVIFAIPTYMFIASMTALITIGVGRMFLGGVQPIVPAELPAATETLGIFLLLRAFSAGCTALTGVEAISNGVPAFRKPEAHNAATTLLWMVGLLGVMFFGISFLANHYGAVPREGVTVVSQIAIAVVGTGPAFLFIQVATALILVLAANTAFADFPRLASLLSSDRFLPRQLSQRGDRLVFSNGIIALSVFAALLIIVFQAHEQAMLPLYAIGVFISFTLSQFGMVVHHRRIKEAGWQRGQIINAVGGVLTSIVLLVLLPILVVIFQSIRQHYSDVAAQLSLEQKPCIEAVRRHTALVLVSGMHKGVIPALQYGLSLAPDNVQAVYIDMEPESTCRLQAKWEQWGCGVPLVVVPSPYRSLLRPLLNYIDEVDRLYEDDVLTIIMPEFIPSRWWQHLLHNQTALFIRTALLVRRGRVVTSVPYRLEKKIG
ncbi:MAG: APC family permease [Roseiflexaceae bacterium]|nr:APC family permease [Roseiflexaceae bacterium]